MSHRFGSVDYPDDDGSPRWHWRWNWACLTCRTHARRTKDEPTPRCPKCRQEMASMPARMRMPAKDDPGWDKAFVRAGMIFWPRRKRK